MHNRLTSLEAERMIGVAMRSQIIRLADHLYAIQTPFIAGQPEPYVTSYLVLGRVAALFDSGLVSTSPDVLALLEQLGRPPANLRLIVNSHAHYDHIGANGPLKEATGCVVVAEGSGVPWIEDHHRQWREFFEAFPDAYTAPETERQHFWDCLGPEASVEVQTSGGFRLGLGDGVALDVFPTPGHISSCVSAVDVGSGALLTGDSFQGQGFFGGLPQYDCVSAYRATLAAYAERAPRLLLTAHTPPLEGADVAAAVRASDELVEAIAETVRGLLRRRGGPVHLREVGEAVTAAFRRPYTVQALFTMNAHLEELARQELARRLEPGSNRWLG